ncbi:MAG: FkbM family methyltransferase [Proteobacteria bacterium]|nr:FkbM family methyltransferase [Pseudomonadota bacterium]
MAAETVTPRLELAVHHVGGRGGTGRFPLLPQFARDFVNVLYEADESCIQEIADDDPGQYVIPRCVSHVSAQTEFNILYNASASSVHDIDARFFRDLPWLGEGSIDYDPAAWSTIRRSEMMGITLDDILEQQYSDVPAPDFLSLNTQGNEADILLGGRRTLSKSCIALQLEISLRPIYQQQSTFDRLVAGASELGFELVRLLPHGARGQGFTAQDRVVRTPIGLRGGGVTLQADAIFFKAPDAVLSGHKHPMRDLVKGIFIGFVLSYFDYSYACAETFLRLADASQRSALEGVRERYAYIDFALSYLAEIERFPRIYPVVWTDVFGPGSDKPRAPEEIKDRYFKANDEADFMAGLEMLTDRDYILTERLAARFGLRQQAELLKSTRLASVWDTLKRLGLASSVRA